MGVIDLIIGFGIGLLFLSAYFGIIAAVTIWIWERKHTDE